MQTRPQINHIYVGMPTFFSKVAIIFILFLATTKGFNQQTVVLSGKVQDSETKIPIEYATISVYSAKDSSLIGGGVSELEGAFSFEVPATDGYVDIEFLSFNTKTVSYQVNNQTIIDLGMVSLMPSSISIDEVTVTVQKSTSQFLLDKRVFNVGQDIASRGGTAQDLLNNVPSVAVDIEGNVTMRGGSNVRIFINGRPSTLVGLNGANGLRNIQANMIERVEVITNPSSKYEAEGMTGIINIVLKKDSKGGFNSSFEISGGLPDLKAFNTSLNYRKGLTNFFVNYGIRYNKNPGLGSSFLERYEGPITKSILTQNTRTRSRLDNSFRSGLEFYLSEKEVLTASFTYTHENGDNNALLTYRYGEYSGTKPKAYTAALTDFIQRDNIELELSPRTQYSVDYSKEYEQKGKTLTGNIQYQNTKESEENTYEEKSVENAVVVERFLSQRSGNLEGEKNLSGQLDFVQPFGENGKLETGFRRTLRNINNDYLIEELTGEVWTKLENLSNNFIYKEGVHGIYANYGNKVDKFSYQMGLRYEYSMVSTELVTTNDINNRNYGGLFPSGFLNYELGSGNQFQFSYSRRINRPRFRELNPFFGFTDRINFFSGNPNLNPQYTNAIELSHLKFWDWGSLSSSLYFRRTNDVTTDIKTINPDGTTFTKPENLGKEDNSGFEFNTSFSGLKWLRFDTELNVFYSRFFDAPQRPELNTSSIATRARINTRFNFWKGAEAQLRWNYNGPRKVPQGSQRAFRSLDLGVSKDLLGDRMSLTFSWNDVFNQRRWRFERITPTFYEDGDWQGRRSSATLTLAYRINAKKQEVERRGEQDNGNENGGGVF
ncbi:MAG TPA: outer membrane beta-barrel family protein [Saprospiraceae bacterium]|nr:outer membrane beta-barrel family protein [Saprospiraceae bacterium]